jgi:MtrB/PioB family decaheme-associated outer membrane protein
MRAKLIAIPVAGLLAASPLAFAEEGELVWSGSVTVGARYVDDKADDPSKLNEYRDLGSGGSGIAGFELRGRGDRYYTNLYGENLGQDDQYLDVRGGSYGVFKYRLYSDELRHNFGSGPGALSPFSGIGGSTLNMANPRPAVATWGTFDHSYDRRDMGAMVEWQATSPWYFRVDTNEVKREGINVFAGAKSTSPGGGFMDLPTPIDYTTTNVSGEFGYAAKRGHFAVNLLHSEFKNGNDVLRWTNEFFSAASTFLDTTVLPPDNKLTRLSVNGNLRQLFWDSTLAGRLVFTNLSNDVTMQQNMLSTGNTNPATNPSAATFQGDIKRTNLSLSLSSRPTKALDTRAYLDYAKEENDSTHMSFAPAAGTGLTGGSSNPLSNCNSTATNPCEPELFHYTKSKVGVEAGYRLTRANRFSGGLEYADIERERADFQETREHRFFAQWKNSSFDWLTGRVKYQHLSRSSHFDPHVAVLAANPMDLYVRRFDIASVDQNLIKFAVDVTPAPFLDIGLEAIVKHNDYKDTILGRTKDERKQFYASLGYGDPRSLRFLVFGDVEYVRFDSFHRVGTGNPDPSTPPTATTYNWSADNDDKAWQVGLGLDWVPMARLKLKGSVIHAKTKGGTEFFVEPGGPATPRPSITNVDNTKRTSFDLRAIYAFDKRWDFTGGYAYEKYTYDDIGYSGTLYVTSATNTAGVVTGQFSFQPYKANILYATAKYKF